MDITTSCSSDINVKKNGLDVMSRRDKGPSELSSLVDQNSRKPTMV